MDTTTSEAASAAIGTVARLYQITPGDAALGVLLAEGFTSGHDVTAMPRQQFIDSYAVKLGGPDIAEMVYLKALQVTTVVYTFFGAALQQATSPQVFATSPPPNIGAEAQSNLIKQYPTLEQIFGSLDFCACDDCRSVLSPAAYLVDLLRFLDPGPLQWQGPGQTPFEVLAQRRPDLPQLPLTCENTNTVLPYLDVVNEILEYHVAHGGLDASAVHDTGEARSEDLLAEPAHIIAAVYDTTLRQTVYPVRMPLHLWLETVRRFLAHFDAPLWMVLDAFRATDELYPDVGETAEYGRAAVAAERLGLGPHEVALLATAAPQPVWPAWYGFDSANEALTALTSAKALSRRLDVSYTELIELLRTGFVNPRLPVLATLRRLGVDLADVLRFLGQPGYPPFNAAEQTAFAATLGTDGAQMVQAAFAAGDFSRMLVLADPNAGCGFDTTTLRYADGSPADPIAFILLNHLVRLWRRLGWPLDEIDRALVTFLPTQPNARTPATIGPAMASALLGTAHLAELAERLGLAGQQRASLLVCWADLDERGYADVFLTPGKSDPLFAPASVAAGTAALADNLTAALAALNLTAPEVEEILLDSGTSVVAAPLSLATLSLLRRHAVLARALRLSVTELVTLKGLSGVDPFPVLPAQPVTVVADDVPQMGTIRFVELAMTVAESGFERRGP